MPGLIRGVARTAVVAGTATAVSGRVQRRQAEKYADKDAAIYAEREQAYQQQMAPPPQQQVVYAAPPPQQYAAPPPPPPPAPAPAPQVDVVGQLTQLAALRDSGVLTEAEFEAQKAKILAAS